jgi:3-isopropylmalate/(R)-2-methylmalate dehydratase small subunit
VQVLRGRIWKFGDDINTDLIQPSLPGATPRDRAAACFSANRPGWSGQVQRGDMLVAGRNFGTGSSRPAAGNLLTLGVACVIAESINGLFARNSINLGLPVLSIPGVADAFEEPDVAEVDLTAGQLRNVRTGNVMNFSPLPGLVLDVLEQGGLMAVMLKRGYVDPSPRRENA